MRFPVLRRPPAALLLLAAAALPAAAQEFPATPGPLRLAEGDTLVFLGDSITHQCLYTQYVEDFLYTRFPRLRLHLHNAGVGGDTARDALERFDEDVAAFHPAAVLLLLGMNDGRYTAPDPKIFATYKKDMGRILDESAALGSRPIPLAPTWFDQRTALRGKNWIPPDRAAIVHYNATLAAFGAWLRDEAEARGLLFADLAAPLAQATRKARRDDPVFTMIPDAVHPGPDGHLVMALALLEGLGFEGELSALEIFREGGRWRVEARGGTLSKVSGDRIRFVFQARGLPWVVPEDAAAGFRATRAGLRMSRESLRVAGLEPGRYTLTIDGKTAGAWTARELSRGIELEENPATPQYGRALQVALLNKKRNREAVHPARDLWSQRKIRARTREKDEAGFTAWLANFRRQLAPLAEKARELEERIHAAARPRPHLYELLPAQ